MQTIPYEKFKHGQRVTCEIDGVKIDDAKISIGKNGLIYLCSNSKSGDNNADEKLGYKYSYSFLTKNQNYEETDYRTLKNLHFLDRTLDDLEEGDVLVDENGDEQKVLGICGNVYFLSEENEFTKVDEYYYTTQELEDNGYTLKQEEEEEEEKESVDSAYFYITQDKNKITYDGNTYILSKLL